MALARELECELVIAEYLAFLTATVQGRALSDVRRVEKMLGDLIQNAILQLTADS